MLYVQSDSFAMDASLALILANLWMKSSGKSLKNPIEGKENKVPGMKGMCTDCKRRVTLRGKGVECKTCKNWFHAKVTMTQQK